MLSAKVWQTLIALSICCSSYAGPNQKWASRFDGSAHGADQGNAIAVDSAGNCFVTGSFQTVVTGMSNAQYDAVTIKYDGVTGSTLWSKALSGSNSSGPDNLVAIGLDASGNVFVCGWEFNLVSGFDYITAKYKGSNGDLLWAKSYNGIGSLSDAASALVVDHDGNVIVTGTSSENTSGGKTNYVTIKYDGVTGNELWIRAYRPIDNGCAGGVSVAVDSLNNVFVAGQSGGQPYLNNNTIIKYSSGGTLLWTQRFGPLTICSSPVKIVVDHLNNPIAAGILGTSSAPAHSPFLATPPVYLCTVAVNPPACNTQQLDYYAVKYNGINGNILWERSFDGPAHLDDNCYDAVVNNANDIYITGSVYVSSNQKDYGTIKLNGANGNQLWSSFYGEPNTDNTAYSIALTSHEEVIVTGVTSGVTSPFGPNKDYATVKYNRTNGVQLWAIKYNGSGNDDDYPSAVAVDSTNHVIVTGASKGSGTDYDIATVSYQDCPLGDLNSDCCVDDTDLLLVINNFLTTNPAGDVNTDGIVDDTDLLIVINNFLQGC